VVYVGLDPPRGLGVELQHAAPSVAASAHPVEHLEWDRMNADERRFAVLRAIVADYVATHEPVGSKMIVDRHNLGVSSATVRNDMACWRRTGSSPSRTPARAGCPPTRATACSSTG
jgi:hypothetical protein